MKKLSLNYCLAIILFLTGFALTSCSNDDDPTEDTVITVKDLPQKAQDFLSQYFPNISATSVEKEQIGNTFIYEIDLANNTEIVFNSDGEWQQVDAASGMTIPTGFILSEIVNYVNENYPDYGINEINKSGEGYIVEINTSDEVTLTFNMMGEYTGTISNY